MLPFALKKKKADGYTILCLGAHCDDIEIGCGGTIIKWLKEHKKTTVHWIVFSKDKIREGEARQSAGLFLRGAKGKKVVVKDFRNGFFPYIGGEIKDYFEQLKNEVNPDIIFTHFKQDLHQDHRLLSDLTWNTFRNHLILEYEIPKYDGDFSSPNFYVSLDEEICREKVETVISVFKSQRNKHWFTEDLFLSVLRLRGMEACSESGFAEGFYCRKVSL